MSYSSFVKKKSFSHRYAHVVKVLAACALFLFFVGAVVSYDPLDQSWFYRDSSHEYFSNIGGLIGAQCAALLFYLFGSAALVCIPFLFFVLKNWYQEISLRDEWDRYCAFGLLLIVSSAFCFTYGISLWGSPVSGGFVGFWVVNFVYQWCGSIGLFLFLYTHLFMSVVLLSRFAYSQVLYWVCMNCYLFAQTVQVVPVFRALSVRVYAGLKIGACFIFNMVCVGVKKLASFLNVSNATYRYEMSLDDMQEVSVEDFMQKNSDTVLHGFESKACAVSPVIDIADAGKAVDDEYGRIEDQGCSDALESVSSYLLPEQSLFNRTVTSGNDHDIMKELEMRARVLEEKLNCFGISGSVVSIKQGPVVTLFEYRPEIDSKISKIIAREDDLALALQALSIRIIAPIPGKSVVGFEVANVERASVLFSDSIHSSAYTDFPGALPLILGKDTIGNELVVDLARMPHLLIAGSTGSGKSVALNGMLISLLCARRPDELRLILIDPKRLEFVPYADIGHLLFPIITNPKDAAPVLQWVVNEMEDRYKKMAECGARSLDDYNTLCQSDEKKPLIVVVIDELSDLMITAGREIEGLIVRITQMARAAGIHMVIATQRPSVDVVTGLIKVNFPSRISFRVTSKVDSRTILDCGGADKLLGRGDMLFLDSADSSLKRVHGAYVSDQEIQMVTNHIRLQGAPEYYEIVQPVADNQSDIADGDAQLYESVVGFLHEIDEISISLLQRKFRIGYNRSARIIDLLESRGLIMPSEGGKMRKVIR